MTGAWAGGDKCPTCRGQGHVRRTAGGWCQPLAPIACSYKGPTGAPPACVPRPGAGSSQGRGPPLCPAFHRPSAAHLAQASGFRGLRLLAVLCRRRLRHCPDGQQPGVGPLLRVSNLTGLNSGREPWAAKAGCPERRGRGRVRDGR